MHIDFSIIDALGLGENYFDARYFALPEFYVPLGEAGLNAHDWKECLICELKPRVYIFNNGTQAACGCYKDYCPIVRTESINSRRRRIGSSESYRLNDLKIVWNYWIMTGHKIELQPGRW